MRRENMKFVAETLPPSEPKLTIKEKVLISITTAKDGLTAGELYDVLSGISPRNIRLSTQDLVAERLISKERKCRCHGSSIYEVTK